MASHHSKSSAWATALIVSFMLLAAGIGSLVYSGLKAGWSLLAGRNHPAAKTLAKPAVTAAARTASSAAVQKLEPCPAVDPMNADRMIKAAARAKIPLKAGLTLVETWSIPAGDFETLTQIVAIDGAGIHTTDSGPRLSNGKPAGTMSGRRVICLADLDEGRILITQGGPKTPEVVRHSVKFSVPSLFRDLDSRRPAPFEYMERVASAGPDAYTIGSRWKGTLYRWEREPVPFSLLVNGDRIELPTLHAWGDASGDTLDVNILDDAANPLLVNFNVNNGNFQLKLTRITFPSERGVESELKQRGRADVYGIYFDFNSDELRPESEPVLREIAEALERNPEWKLSVEGHTDGIGGESANLGLSLRRSAAVKNALEGRYRIAEDRLSAAGFGASRPKGSNDTVEGRALNRRVELVRKQL